MVAVDGAQPGVDGEGLPFHLHADRVGCVHQDVRRHGAVRIGRDAAAPAGPRAAVQLVAVQQQELRRARGVGEGPRLVVDDGVRSDLGRRVVAPGRLRRVEEGTATLGQRDQVHVVVQLGQGESEHLVEAVVLLLRRGLIEEVDRDVRTQGRREVELVLIQAYELRRVVQEVRQRLEVEAEDLAEEVRLEVAEELAHRGLALQQRIQRLAGDAGDQDLQVAGEHAEGVLEVHERVGHAQHLPHVGGEEGIELVLDDLAQPTAASQSVHWRLVSSPPKAGLHSNPQPSRASFWM